VSREMHTTFESETQHRCYYHRRDALSEKVKEWKGADKSCCRD